MHPEYKIANWRKWRLTYEGGERFINKFLYRRNKEKPEDFQDRRKTTYNVNYVKSGVNKIRNSILNQLNEILRESDSESYLNAFRGLNRGVDMKGSSYIKFLIDPLTELLVLGKVGIYVDSPNNSDLENLSFNNNHPYLYYYPPEDIIDWRYDDEVLTRLLLRDSVYDYDELGFPQSEKDRFRFYILGSQDQNNRSNGVNVYLSDRKSDLKTAPLHQTLDLDEIPFVIGEVSSSLLVDVCNLQIALLNIESSDVDFILKSNIPFYIEQYDPRQEQYNQHVLEKEKVDEDGKKIDEEQVIIGSTQGRKYAAGLQAPSFIHPSSEPIQTSMSKEDQIKRSIYTLLDISLLEIEPRSASAESRSRSERALESGMSAFGLVLNQMDSDIGRIWSKYENTLPPNIIYPEVYDTSSDETKIREATDILSLKNKVTSATYKRELMKMASERLLRGKAPEKLLDISSEIDESPGTSSDPEDIASDIEHGIVGVQTASILRGYSDEEYLKAEESHARRLIRIQEAQSNPSARGLSDLDGEDNADAEKEASQNPDNDPDGVSRTRS